MKHYNFINYIFFLLKCIIEQKWPQGIIFVVAPAIGLSKKVALVSTFWNDLLSTCYKKSRVDTFKLSPQHANIASEKGARLYGIWE